MLNVYACASASACVYFYCYLLRITLLSKHIHHEIHSISNSTEKSKNKLNQIFSAKLENREMELSDFESVFFLYTLCLCMHGNIECTYDKY